MSLVGQIDVFATKAIDVKGGVKDAIFKKSPYLKRLRAKQEPWEGNKKTYPFWYKDDTLSTGKYYQGAESLGLDQYDPATELEFDLIELEESLVITHRDIAKVSGKYAALDLVKARVEHMEMAMRQRFMKGIYSDGTAATGAGTTKQFVGMAAFLKSSSVNYGGLTDTQVSAHVAKVNSNSGTARAFSTALDQDVLGGATEGEVTPTLRIMPQLVMNQFIETIKPSQLTVREGSLDGLGHKLGGELVYNGVVSIVDNLFTAGQIAYINENFVKLLSHPDYDMKVVNKTDLEDSDALLKRIFFKGAYACSVLRYQGLLKDIATA